MRQSEFVKRQKKATFSVNNIERLLNMISQHKWLQATIRKKAKSKKAKAIYIENNIPNLNKRCQKDLNLLAELSIASKQPKLYDVYKNTVYRTLGYCVKESL